MKEIELKSVNKFYKPDVVALEDISLSIDQGEFVFVTGRSGSGKSTILKLLCGQILPSSGGMWVRGEDVSALTRRQLPYYRRQFGIMQSDLGLLKEQTVRQNIELAMRATEQPLRLTKKRVEQTMRTMGIAHRADHFPRELSGGEAQRIKLASELSKRSTGKTIYILDEPTTGLHFADVHKLTEILRRLSADGNTVLVIEHNLDVIKTADYIIDMGPEGGDGGGTVIARGTPEEVAQNSVSYTGKYIKDMLQKELRK